MSARKSPKIPSLKKECNLFARLCTIWQALNRYFKWCYIHETQDCPSAFIVMIKPWQTTTSGPLSYWKDWMLEAPLPQRWRSCPHDIWPKYNWIEKSLCMKQYLNSECMVMLLKGTEYVYKNACPRWFFRWFEFQWNQRDKLSLPCLDLILIHHNNSTSCGWLNGWFCQHCRLTGEWIAMTDKLTC